VEPDVVMACAGDIPTNEALAAVAMLREQFPDLKIRFINVVDLLKLAPSTEHPHGLSDRDFDSLFTVDKPIIFNFHGYPWLIHRLTYRRTTTGTCMCAATKRRAASITPLDLAIRNQIDRSAWRSTSSIMCAPADRRRARQGAASHIQNRLSELCLRARRRQARGRRLRWK